MCVVLLVPLDVFMPCQAENVLPALTPVSSHLLPEPGMGNGPCIPSSTVTVPLLQGSDKLVIHCNKTKRRKQWWCKEWSNTQRWRRDMLWLPELQAFQSLNPFH